MQSCFSFATGLVAGAALLVQLPSAMAEGDALAAEHAPFVPGEIIVRFAQPPGEQLTADVDAALGTDIQWSELRHAPHAKGQPGVPHPLSYWRIAILAADADVVALAEQVARVPGVVYAGTNNQPTPTYTPNDPMFNQQWAHQKINSEAGWDVSTGSRSIIVGVIIASGSRS